MNTALIVAAGSGTRAQLNQSKILYKINDKPVFMYSVDLFLSLGFQVVLVVSKADLNEITKYVFHDRIKIVSGGKTRSESVKFGLKEVETPYVYIHDAARPLIHKNTILNIEKALEIHDAVLLVEKLTSALKYHNADELISLPRDEHVLAQTPQAFLTEKIRYAYVRSDQSFDDDVSLYQSFYPDEKISVVINDSSNFKITYKQDLKIAGLLLNERAEYMRIGHSFDIHQLVEGRPLILGGVLIPYEKGLLGHSDADCLLHVIAESMLGALSLGDLGTFYPDTDASIKDISSVNILIEVYKQVKDKGYVIGNIDSTIYAELPKMSPHIQAMKESISKILHIDQDFVSIKATTYEKLDAIGEQKAIAAEAVVILKKV